MSKSGCGRFSEKILKIDAFGRPFEFMLPNGTKRYKTLVGTILTVILTILVTLYTVYKVQLLLNNEQVIVTLTSEENYFVKNEALISSSEDGFNIAVGLFQLEHRANKS